MAAQFAEPKKTNKINAMRCNFQQDVVSWSLFYAVLLVRSNKNSTGGYQDAPAEQAFSIPPCEKIFSGA